MASDYGPAIGTCARGQMRRPELYLGPVSQVDKMKQATMMGGMKRLLSVPEAAARFEVTSQTVRNWISTGRLSALQTTKRGRYRITPEELEKLERDMSTANGDRGADESLGHRLSAEGLDLGDELDRVVHAIVAAVKPEAVYLFGSRARGDAKPDSDFDLALIVLDGSSRRRTAMKSYESLATVRGRTVGVDVVVLTPQILAAERDLVGSIARSIVREGVPVYGSAVV